MAFTTQRQQYQKTRAPSRAHPRSGVRLARCMALMAFLGLTGCASGGMPKAAASPESLGATQPDAPASPAGGASASLSATMTNADARQALIDAHDAMKGRQWSQLAQLVPAASRDPLLGAYAQYWLLRHQLSDPNEPVPTAAVKHFVDSTDNTWLVQDIKADWIVAAARSADYGTVNRIGPVNVDRTSVECSRLLAQHMTGGRVSATDALAAFKPIRSCWALFDQLVPNKVLGWNDIDPLMRAALEDGKTGNASRLASYLFDASEMRDYRALMKHARKWLDKQHRPQSRERIELVTLALSRLGRGDRDKNAEYIEQHWARAIPKQDLEWVWGQFGLVAALRVDDDAAKWYRRSGKAPMTDYNHAWQVRTELRQAKISWPRVRDAILKMTARQQAEPVWTYWYGRALEAEGNRAEADKYFSSIENDYGFYGQLANEALGRQLTIPPEPKPVTTTEEAAARANMGLERAVALFQLGWRHQAVPEWNYALRGMTDRQLLAAAKLADDEHIFDRVINTSLRTQHTVDFKQRFIAPFEGQVAAKAKLINLDVAWVYGLIRQESRFITDARSHVGASGLMQLMPGTAKWVAKKIGMADFSPSTVNDFDTNTILGTNYLNMVLQDLNGSQLLATAGYNAGPRRPMLWRSKLPGPVEGAIFAETIPFTETRLYVKNVMSNATYYAMMFSGKPFSLKKRLGVVSPEPDRQVALP
ncbi:MAG TPA: transglycosylase SLT domain-containing protein [Burkholderiaceae bacterium]|nr:transglycosylase SLT domain-containing protein [Burkholderiaceae bacterium]